MALFLVAMSVYKNAQRHFVNKPIIKSLQASGSFNIVMITSLKFK
ncbi:hypothetical protein [Helicobacter pylori]|nr:hypothetical protein [Helicobacter pylori]